MYILCIFYVYLCFEAHMEDWVTKCVASVKKDFTYLLTNMSRVTTKPT
jgi:hypothetical protein